MSSPFADVTPLLGLGKDGTTDTVVKSVDSNKRRLGIGRTRGAEDDSRVTVAMILKSALAILVAAAGLAASTMSFIISPAIVVYIMGSICSLNFAIVTCNEWRILLSGNWTKEAVERIRNMMDVLEKEKVVLEDNVETLTMYVSRFGDVEHELQEMAQAEESSIDRCLELVKMNEESMDKMRENLRQKIMQDVIEILIRRDICRTQTIDRVEARLVALKIAVKLESYGVIFDEDKFLRVVALNPTLMGVAGAVRKLLPPYERHGDDFSVDSDKDDIYDMFYMSRPDQNETGSTVDGILESLASRSFSERRHIISSGRDDILSTTQ